MTDLKEAVFDLIAEAQVEIVDPSTVKLTLPLQTVVEIAQAAGMPPAQIGALLDIDIEMEDESGKDD